MELDGQVQSHPLSYEEEGGEVHHAGEVERQLLQRPDVGGEVELRVG